VEYLHERAASKFRSIRVILSAGAFDSLKLLMLSELVIPEELRSLNISADQWWQGQNLQDSLPVVLSNNSGSTHAGTGGLEAGLLHSEVNSESYTWFASSSSIYWFPSHLAMLPLQFGFTGAVVDPSAKCRRKKTRSRNGLCWWSFHRATDFRWTILEWNGCKARFLN